MLYFSQKKGEVEMLHVEVPLVKNKRNGETIRRVVLIDHDDYDKVFGKNKTLYISEKRIRGVECEGISLLTKEVVTDPITGLRRHEYKDRSLANVLTGCALGIKVKHVNGDRLDFRRRNLKPDFGFINQHHNKWKLRFSYVYNPPNGVRKNAAFKAGRKALTFFFPTEKLARHYKDYMQSGAYYLIENYKDKYHCRVLSAALGHAAGLFWDSEEMSTHIYGPVRKGQISEHRFRRQVKFPGFKTIKALGKEVAAILEDPEKKLQKPLTKESS